MNLSELVRKVVKKKPNDKGAYGEIYKFKHEGKNRVLKIIKPDPDLGIINLVELDTMQRLVHPNLMKADVVSVMRVKGEQKTVIVMEEADCDLWKYLEKSIPFDVKLQIIVDICQGLAFLHKNDILHLDLNPSNILIFKHNGQVHARLTDFGLSLFSGNSPVRLYDQVLVTITHRPPEVGFTKPFEYSKGTDMWSLGMLIYQILVGSLPFADLDSKSIDEFLTEYCGHMDHIIEFLTEDLSSLDDAQIFIDLCSRLLHPDPLQRPSIREVLRLDIFKPYISKQEKYIIKPKLPTIDLIRPILDDYYVFNALYLVAQEFDVYLKTVFVAIDLYHRSRGIENTGKGWIKNLNRMMSCFFMSAKLFEDEPILAEDICDSLGDRLAVKDILKTETLIINKIKAYIYSCQVDKRIKYKTQLDQRFKTCLHPHLYFNFPPEPPENDIEHEYIYFTDFFATTDYSKHVLSDHKDVFLQDCLAHDQKLF